jgi:hypothetical protein
VFESYEVEWLDGRGVWHTVKAGLTTESEAHACDAQYKNWTIRIVKAVRTEIPLVEMDNDSQ